MIFQHLVESNLQELHLDSRSADQKQNIFTSDLPEFAG